MDSLSALDILKEEMASDEIHLKVNAIHRLKTVVYSMKKENFKQVYDYLDEIITLECDEVLFSIADELGDFHDNNLIDPVQDILPLLERLCKSDETVVREQASVSINKLCEKLTDSEVQNSLVPIILRLSQSEWFPGRVSASSLFFSAYPKAGSQKEALRKKFIDLCNEDTTIVRRQGSKMLGDFATTIEKQACINEILPIFRRLAQDEQDSIRIICIDSLIPLAKYLTKEEN